MIGDERGPARVHLLTQVEEAARSIAPLWPLSTAIAVNPLWDLRQMPFHQAVCHAQQVLGIDGYPSPALFGEAYAAGRVTAEDLRVAIGDGRGAAACQDVQAGHEPRARRLQTAAERHDEVFGSHVAVSVDREVAKWCAAYLAGTVPSGPVEGFYAAWRKVVVFDPSARSLAGRAGRKRLAELGADPEDAILTCLDLLDVSVEDRALELARHLARMPGWAGHAKWRSRWAAPDRLGPSLHVVDYLAVRLCYEAVLPATEAAPSGLALMRTAKRRRSRTAPDPRRSEDETHVLEGGHRARTGGPMAVDLPDDVTRHLCGLSSTALAHVWLAAYQGHYRDRLLGALHSSPIEAPLRPQVQVVFCIDARSEGLRRHLEGCGPYETFGFAGFFALPIRFGPWWSDDAMDLCPVLLRPSARVAERPVTLTGQGASRELAGRQAVAAAHSAFDATRKGAVSQFVLAEAGGMVAGPVALAKTLAPSWYEAVRRRAHQVIAPAAPTAIDMAPPADVMSDGEQALLAEAALTTMGLARNFAPLVVLCGHGSTTENNPHASSLDCGACGGNRGGPSARAAAAILNRRAIRALLAERGITIPATTWFVAAEHDTATDTVTVLDTHLVPEIHAEGVVTLQSALDRAGAATAAERASLLPGGADRRRVTSPAGRAADWAQVRPEWGLARNAAFIVAPRSASAGVNLDARCFLHSYDAEADPDGVALETILTAPMVVAHWINAQYYFSTVDPDILSAGDKTVHNIVAGVGVVQGAGGDLRVGLPLQSLYDGDRSYHEPMRLLVVVEAPEMLLEAVIARNPLLQDLFDGQWVHLAARKDGHDNWKIRRAGGRWVRWTPAGTRSDENTARG